MRALGARLWAWLRGESPRYVLCEDPDELGWWLERRP